MIEFTMIMAIVIILNYGLFVSEGFFLILFGSLLLSFFFFLIFVPTLKLFNNTKIWLL